MTDRPRVPITDRRRRVPAPRYAVVIVGAGINGAGLFRDLSLQGVDCLLVDCGDFCSGASAAPSRLIHGGIKYLENGEVRLVRQSTLERNLLLKNAPHYVKPIETVLPIRSWFGGIRPSVVRFLGGTAKLTDRGVLIIKAGLELFDHFGREHRVLPRHRVSLRAATRRAFPEIAPEIVATATYYDARVTHAERLGLELILDAMEEKGGSLALNHARLVGTDGTALLIRDEEDATVHRVEADVVVNAGGAWIDRVNAALGIDTRYIGGNKGSHLIVDNLRLHDALGGKMVYFGATDGRVGLLYPFMGRVLVGSTDIPIADPDLAVCEVSERDYMLAILREVFPDIAVRPQEVVYTYCGVRPLPRADGLDPGAVSRDHSIKTDRLRGSGIPVHSLIGGKWTTFRGFAEEAADLVLRGLGRNRHASTALRPIGGGKNFPRTAAERARMLEALAQSGLSATRSETLLERYGTRALAVAERCAKGNDAPLAAMPDFTRLEIAFIAEKESVVRLADILFRRTTIAVSGRLTAAVAEEIADIACGILGWDDARKSTELHDVSTEGVRQHGMEALRFVDSESPAEATGSSGRGPGRAAG